MGAHEARSAEIAALRGVIAAEPPRIPRILRLARLLAEDGDAREATVMYVRAAASALERDFPFYACVALNQARLIAPGDPAVRAVSARVDRALARLGIRHASPRAGDAPRGAVADILPLTPALDRRYRQRIERCDIALAADGRSLHVVFRHEGPNPGPIAARWFGTVAYAIEVDDGGSPIPVTASLLDAQRFRHELRLVVADPEASARIRSHPSGFTNIRAILLTTGIGAPHRVRNVFSRSALASDPTAVES